MNELPTIRQRLVQTRSPFFLPVAVPFTATVNETAQVSTNPALAPGQNRDLSGDLEILGMTSDLVNVTSSFRLNKRTIWSDDRVPLPMYFGKPDGPKPVRWLEKPLIVPQGYRLYSDLLNVGGEPAGTLVYVGRTRGDTVNHVLVPEGDGTDDVIEIDSNFTGVADEIKQVSSAIIDDDFLIYGLHTNLSDASVEITGVGGTPWMQEAVPLWAVAGRGTSEHPNQRLHQPYLIPHGYKILMKFYNDGAEASGQLFLKGRRLRAAK